MYFDFENLHEMRKYNIKIAAGYKTSIDIYGSKLLLCVELAHKLLNFDTVWNAMEKIYRQRSEGEYKAHCVTTLVGNTVMTNYNNKTYRIDDIVWDQCPEDTFEKKDQSKISFVDYYRENYNINIDNKRQPLLLSYQKLRNGEKRPVLLIPELCVLTGKINSPPILSKNPFKQKSFKVNESW
jgi:aubergine-like protein